jgi:polyisoprenoid-binding protein YceI
MLPSPDVLSPTRWSLDGLEFAVHTALGMTIRGRFDRVAGSYEVGPYGSRIDLAVDAASVDTGNRIWDGLLGSADSPSLTEHPQVSFTSTRVRELGDGMLRVEGQLEGAGKVEPVVFDAAVKAVDHGLRLETAVAIDRQLLGKSVNGFGAFLPATMHLTMHLRAA